MTWPASGLPWARWPWQQCPARTERWERCDLRRHGPEILHALEHGMDIPRWSTAWVITPWPPPPIPVNEPIDADNPPTDFDG